MANISLRTEGKVLCDKQITIKALAKTQYFRDGVPSPLSFHFLATRLKKFRYNAFFRKASHNTYEKQYSTSLSAALNCCKNIEIDFYDSKTFGTKEKPSYWYVRHDMTGGNDNCCTAGGGLATCLADVRLWSDENSGHPPITIFLDKKQGWGNSGEQRNPTDLDNLIKTCIPNEKLFRPRDLKGSYNSLRQAAQNNAWPTMEELTNKFIFVLTGGREPGNHNETHNQYVKETGNEAVLFVAPDADENDDVLKAPNQFGEAEADWVVFYNLKAGNETLAPLIHSKGYISRVWGADEDNSTYLNLIKNDVHFIALYDYHVNSFNNGVMNGLL
ncbi:hypothetical protein EON73_04665 [bacterium]|nr:MAG: hypothetical protein EON73_04665 [bacterium]